jgi:site-specific recombinase XerD
MTYDLSVLTDAKPKAPKVAAVQYVRRLGNHHFAHLRAVAEGLDLQDSAKRYLGIEHGHQARTAHLQTVQSIRAIARRAGEGGWRLIGLAIRIDWTADQPTLNEFIEQRDLDGWSESEVTAMYQETYPVDRRAKRRTQLRQRQLDLIKRLEQQSAEAPSPTDLVTGWFDDLVAQRLLGAGLTTLADLNAKIVTGGRWYRTLPSIGEAKAERIAAHLATLLPRAVRPARALFVLSGTPNLFATPSPAPQRLFAALALPSPAVMEGSEGYPNKLTLASDMAKSENFRGVGDGDIQAGLPSPALPTLLKARNDLEAVDAWIAARSGSIHTAKAYHREANRLLLWLQYERGGKTLRQMDVGDCGDYMAFLQAIPATWISRVRAAPGQPGWAPFRGPLSHRSQALAITLVASLFGWLQSAQYLAANPWPLINQKTGDDRDHQMLDTKAFSEGAMAEVLKYIEAQAPSPSRSRIRFILRFVEAVGLRSAELLEAKLKDFSLEPEGWVIQVFGKGAKNRVAAVPGQAFAALQDYLKSRHLEGIETAPGTLPLLASTKDPSEPIGYQALYEHVRSWFRKAIANSGLPSTERTKLARASTHWLRHTFGTRAVAREVPLDVIQAQMGHASIQTTTAIYGRAPIKRRVDELGKAFG